MQPLFNFHGNAILSVLAFLGTAALLGAAGVAFVILLLRRSSFAARRVLLAGGAVAAAYLAALTGFSLASRERVVEPGNAKYFCEIDCHLAYSVLGARREAALGAARPSRGAWEVVTLRVWFDPGTTSSRRGGSPLTPNPRDVRLVDAEGNRYAPSEEGLRALEASAGRQTPLAAPLRPGESYTTTLVFDVPPGVRSPGLLVTEADPVTRLLIGHERSLLHAKTVFRLRDAPLAGVRS
ncbi:MAG TPA: hypothetical protein VF746_28605 [Longimicrobium sp.]|jgi:hypothetical protein